MSESNGEGHRTRRRAVRSAGPPVEENATATTADAKPSPTAARGAGASGSTRDSGPSSLVAETTSATSVAKQAASQDTPESVAPTAEVAKAKTDAEPSAAVAGKAGIAAVKVAAEPDPADQAAVAGGDGADADKTSLAKKAENTVEADRTSVAAAGTEADEDTAEDSPTEKEAAQTRNRGIARILALAASVLLVLALLCGATLSVFAMRSAHERDERRAEYLHTARQAIVNLTTIRADSAKQDIDRILSLASGEFKTEFDGRVDPFTSIVQQAKVVSSGEIVEAALESDDDSSARVLVAAKQTLTNAGQAEPQTRYYRFRVTVTRGDSGLTVSDVEFVA
ncbi:hypothetical protein AB0M45_31475 [Nocardia sp. NPDC051787]|uniref:hypothetical protein n=1 Tax=Nocardia sp. NPDC051787 TaxID=3155415 RepID=UPI003443B793